MIRVDMQLQVARQSQLNLAAVGQAISATAATLGQVYPDYEFWEVVEKSGSCRYNLRRPGRKLRAVRAIGKGADRIRAGSIVQVGYYERKTPFILRVVGVGDWGAKAPTLYGAWVQAFGNPGLTRAILSAPWTPVASPQTLWTGSSSFASVPLGVLVSGAGLITAQAARNEGDTGWDELTLYIGESSYTAPISPSPPYLVGYGDLWSNLAGDLVLARLGPHLQQLYRFRSGVLEELTLTGLSSRLLNGMNVSLTGKLILGDVLRTYGASGITLNFGGVPWPNVPTETVPGGTLVRSIRCWDANTSLISLAESWSADPTNPAYFGLQAAWVNTGATQQLAVAKDLFVGAYSFRKRALPSEDGDLGLAVLWGWDETLPGGNWSGDKATENNDCSRQLKAYLQALLPASGASVWRREVSVDVRTLPVITDSGILTPLTNWLSDLVESPDIFGGVISEAAIGNLQNGEGSLQPSFANFLLPYRRFLDRPAVVLFPAARNVIQPDDVNGNLSNLRVYYDWLPTAGGVGEVVADAAGNSYWAYAHPVELLAAVGGLSRDEDFRGQFRWPGLGNQPVSLVNEDLSFTVFHNPDFFPLVGRFIEKISASGALIWRADLTQRVPGLAWYATEAELGVPNLSIIGGEAASPHPLGDNIQWVRPCGRVVFVAADVRPLGPNFQPTLQLLILSDASGALLHTVSLLLDDEVLTADVYGSGTETATGDGSEVYFTFYVDQVAELLEVRIDGTQTTAYDLTIDTSTFEVAFHVAPSEGANIEVDYRLTSVVHRAGNYLYDVQTADIRCGQFDGVEFAVLFVAQQSRTVPAAQYTRTLLVQMAASLSTPPAVSTHVIAWGSPSTLALANGKLLDLVFESGSWRVVSR